MKAPAIIRVELPDEDDPAVFWSQAARLDAADAAPEDVVFEIAGMQQGLFGTGAQLPQPSRPPAPASAQRSIPATLTALADRALLHRDGERFALAYRLLRRMRSVSHLPAIASDKDVARVAELARAVRRDMHKMTAFVRFREVADESGAPVFVAWFEPEHHVVRATAPFFVRRFAGMRWSILTPRRCAHWDGETLSFSAGAARTEAAASDPVEDVWRTYYAHIFNPARLKVKAMQAEMPKKYWKNLPEAQLIAPLVRAATARRDEMLAAPPVVSRRSSPTTRWPKEDDTMTRRAEDSKDRERGATLEQLARGEMQCTRCPLYRDATQAVAGEGPAKARLMLVGEQPGDKEDITGRPFVGPAGQLLDKALERAGIARADCFVTNAVKHFKFEPRGKVRLHKSPDRSEIDHCRWWLDRERELVEPELIVALGASAARGVLGHAVKIGETRGRVLPAGHGQSALVTVHPSYLLRLRDEDDKRREWRAFLSDLETVRHWLAERAA